MIIDFHTHTFPDKIAGKAIENLKKSSGYENAIGGKISDLLAEMDRAGVDLSVNLPILTNPNHFDGTIEKLFKQNQQYDKIISVACIHPLCENLTEKFKIICDMGFKGIKLHPFFQNVLLDSKESMKVVELAEKNDLFTIVHPGTDASFIGIDMASPNRIFNLINAVKPEKLVLAHMGAMEYWDFIEREMCKINAFFDTSFSMDQMEKKQFLNIVKKHGANKILFGTDSPWISQGKYVELFKSLDLSDEEKQLILFKNAKKLLKI